MRSNYSAERTIMLREGARFSLENLKDTEVYIATSGAIILEHPLEIRQLENSRVFLIAAGNIIIPELQLSSNSDVELLAYSARGRVTIGKQTSADLCLAGEVHTAVKLRLEAEHGVSYGEQHWPFVIGCPIKRDARYWVEGKLLGANHGH